MRALPAVRAGDDRAGLHQVLEADHLGLDEPTLEVGVDDPGRLRGGVADVDGPRPRLLRPGRQERLQPERGEPHVHQLLEPRLLLPVAAQQLRGIGGVEARHLRLDLRAQHDRRGGADTLGQAGRQSGVAQRALVDVEDVDERLGRQQVQVAQQRGIDLALRCRLRDGAAGTEDALRPRRRRRPSA